MPNLRKPELIRLVAHSLREDGWQVLRLGSGHPGRLRIMRGDVAHDLWLHIWNLSPGGRPKSRPLERRIQPTGIGSAFTNTPGVRTLIMGWSSEVGVFVAFDPAFHSGPIGSSSSLQIDLPALIQGHDKGLGVHAKGTGELALAIRPDVLGIYVEQAEAMHASGATPAEADMLARMGDDPLAVDEVDVVASAPPPRQRGMTKALRLLRDRRFGERVFAAYRHRCALCDVQLRLLDAAHILPVSHPDSTDLVTNGVALCALHHRAYDRAVVTFDEKYGVIVNNAVLARLDSEGLGGGTLAFKGALRSTLRMPQATMDRPSKLYIKKANALRGW